MEKFYDEFIKQKPKEMAKTLEDITYKYLNPETQQPTVVPAKHFEKQLNEQMEMAVSETVYRQFLTIIYTQLKSLKVENEDLFNKALMCMELGINPKDMRISEQIALDVTVGYVNTLKETEKKEYHLIRNDIADKYKEALENGEIQKQFIANSHWAEILEEEALESIAEQDRLNGISAKEIARNNAMEQADKNNKKERGL